jgi:hypothetical protein
MKRSILQRGGAHLLQKSLFWRNVDILCNKLERSLLGSLLCRVLYLHVRQNFTIREALYSLNAEKRFNSEKHSSLFKDILVCTSYSFVINSEQYRTKLDSWLLSTGATLMFFLTNE